MNTDIWKYTCPRSCLNVYQNAPRCQRRDTGGTLMRYGLIAPAPALFVSVREQTLLSSGLFPPPVWMNHYLCHVWADHFYRSGGIKWILFMLISIFCSYLLPKRLFPDLNPNTASSTSSQRCHISRTLITLTIFLSVNIGIKSRSGRLSVKHRHFSHLRLYLLLFAHSERLTFHLCVALKVLLRHFNFPLENQIE